jgi:mono/diheme cytochrome c family protein
LFSAFTAFFAMIALNKLPRFSNPIFTNPRFDRATNDKFFLYVEATDTYYNRDSVKELLGATHPDSLDEVLEDTTPNTLPRPILLGLLLIVVTGLIPAMIILNMRAGYSTAPRFHVFFDMDFQPKKKAQQPTTIFADSRIMRPQVRGTIARGQLEEQDPFYLGYDPSKMTMLERSANVMLVSAQTPADGKAPDDATKTSDTKQTTPVPNVTPEAPKLPWIDKLPIEATEEHMKLGKLKFETYCSACHGYAGNGDGLVHKRADSLVQGTWIPPTSMHIDRVRIQPVGQIFNTISKGQGKMASYASSLSPKERWSIVLYVRALQRSRNANIEDVPAEFISTLDEEPKPTNPKTVSTK